MRTCFLIALALLTAACSAGDGSPGANDTIPAGDLPMAPPNASDDVPPPPEDGALPAASPTPDGADNGALADAAADIAPSDSAEMTATTPGDARPSFDCAAKLSLVEQRICDDPRLAQLDDQVAARYAAVRDAADAAERPGLIDGQRKFLRLRNACRDATCIADAYTDRLAELEEDRD